MAGGCSSSPATTRKCLILHLLFFVPPLRLDVCFSLDRLAPAAKKPKGAPEAPSAATPPPAGEGDRDARASPARSSSQGLAELAGASPAPMAQVTPEVPLSAATTTTIGAQQTPPRDVVIVPPLLSPPAPPTAASPTPPAVLERADVSPSSSAVLERAVAELDRLRQDLLGADPCLVAGRLEQASGWIRSDASIRAMLVQASTACD